MFDPEIAGVAIASMRKRTGLSQETLADLLSVSPQAVSKWENGRSLPAVPLLPALAQIFSCSIDDLLLPAYTADTEEPRVWE
jgi:transcriptional regulator with XRE-family HTH domain